MIVVDGLVISDGVDDFTYRLDRRRCVPFRLGWLGYRNGAWSRDGILQSLGDELVCGVGASTIHAYCGSVELVAYETLVLNFSACNEFGDILALFW